MLRNGTLLIVDGSLAARQFFEWTLRARFPRVESACDAAEAIRRLERAPRVSAVVADAQIAGGVLALLGRLRRREVAAPALLALAGRMGHGEEIRILLGGAIGCLRKPVAPGDLLRAFGVEGEASAGAPQEPGPVGVAKLLDPAATGSPILVWEVRDLSRLGARLRTLAPLPERTPLRLDLAVAGESFVVEAEVLRAPAGGSCATCDVAVAFRGLAEPARARLDRCAAQGPASPG